MPSDSPNYTQANIVYRLSIIQPRVDKIHEDVYEGRGPDNPSIIMRLDRQEKLMEERKKKDDRTHAYIMSGFFLLLATFLTLLGNLLSKHI
jgi:F420-dependent methylenetetrahydromethanopterin dehydrogenase